MVVPLSYNGTPENCHNPKNGPLKKVPPEVCTAVSRVHGAVMQLYILSSICSLSQYSKDITKEIWSPAMVRSCRSSRWGEFHGQPTLLSSPRCCWAFLSLWRRRWSELVSWLVGVAVTYLSFLRMVRWYLRDSIYKDIAHHYALFLCSFDVEIQLVGQLTNKDMDIWWLWPANTSN